MAKTLTGGFRHAETGAARATSDGRSCSTGGRRQQRRSTMSDIFDHDGSRDGLRPEDRPFRSREELEAENERLREDLHRTRQENEMLAELITGQFEDGSGQIAGGAGGSGGSSELEQRFAISEAAIDLFEVLPLSFTLDEALDRAVRL